MKFCLLLLLSSFSFQTFQSAHALTQAPWDDENESTLIDHELSENDLSDETFLVAPVEHSYPRIGYRGSRITEKNLTLFGRGNYNHRTHEIITLACVGDLDLTTQMRSCDMLQFVLIDANKQATWASDSFYFESKKAFKNRMKNLERNSRAPSFFDADVKLIPGALIAFGGWTALAATVSVGVGTLYFATIVAVLVTTKNNWDAVDFITPLPRLLVSTLKAKPFLATADKDGWSWAENPVRMRPKKFERLKHLLERRERI